jgi:hypothetical protein
VDEIEDSGLRVKVKADGSNPAPQSNKLPHNGDCYQRRRRAPGIAGAALFPG